MKNFIMLIAIKNPTIYDRAYHLRARSNPNNEIEKISGLMFGKGIIKSPI
tara:strand:+ start:80 stop:229 length:150 start_codon:yes stop_codon:yes gene_type:complete